MMRTSISIWISKVAITSPWVSVTTSPTKMTVLDSLASALLNFSWASSLPTCAASTPPPKPKSVGIELADVKSGRGGRLTLEWWKCYLDSCASYHTFFVKEFIKNIQEGGGTMTGRCHSGTTRTNTRGSYGDFKVWLNKKGIANLFSILMLEASMYTVSTHI